MDWQSEALSALKQDVPFFVRPAVRRRIEMMALEAGCSKVDLAFYRDAKASMAPK
ncbi:MAG: protochlorophyllide oxidoreductase [Cyanobium sp. SAT1300]|nr:protochlorophyllide oxidoreductase [Cyanobium sp. SAT1300]